MHYDLLITPEQLNQLISDHKTSAQTPYMIFDCSFDLGQPEAGFAQYQSGHIPGAIYVHLDQHLSAAKDDEHPASGGRHPLPSRERFAQWLSEIGFQNDMQAVIYDRQGANYCARLWWMLQWAGHSKAAVLDGGFGTWQAMNPESVSTSAPSPLAPSNFELRPPLRRLWSVSEVHDKLDQVCLVDARSPERYRGEVEPLDPVAGHVPGALNRPFSQNIALDGRFKPAALLRAEFEALLPSESLSDPAKIVHYCGSGVSALPNLLAMELAGVSGSGLMAGSWSEWCANYAS